eukprot:CAMPEP_0178839374 /NCGR_PEP_ID=MMETSP0746-20121128/13833_1 /TAXON_ID=913974 /ORGANISM="Nitzschia punctata, Strain CCMP561" /LENGTH=362 /DNA_ID=CAMNT_0020502425 /DNA_START=154 /DNA_END=1242 /DNA_ORIENTATION=-
MRFGKFQSLFTFMVLVLQVAVNELVDADTSRTYPYVYQWPAIQWACEPLLETPFPADLPPLKRKTRNLCLKLRGGKLGGGKGESTTASTIEADEFDVSLVSDEFVFSLFQENDGSESDPDGIPRRYLKMQNNKRDNAKKALEATIEWRKEHNVNSILARPHPKFDVCKEVFPHYFCGRDDSNHVILLQRPGLINLPLAYANGLTGEELLFHYVYEMEYLWQIIEKENPDATMTSIIDLTGLNISVLRRAELLKVAQMFCTTMDAHFPQRSHRTLLINAPKWFGAIYKLISPLLRESTKQKIQILSKGKKQDEALKDLLSECPNSTGQQLEEIPPSDMEAELRNFCLARLDDAGMSMQTVVTA